MIKADKPEVAGGRSRNEADRCHRGSAGHYRSAELGPGRNLPSGSGGDRIRHEIWRDVAPKLGCVWAGGAGGAVSGAHLEVDSAPLVARCGLARSGRTGRCTTALVTGATGYMVRRLARRLEA